MKHFFRMISVLLCLAFLPLFALAEGAELAEAAELAEDTELAEAAELAEDTELTEAAELAEGTEWRCPSCGYWATGEECSECGEHKPVGAFIYLGENNEYGIISSDDIEIYSRYSKDGDGSAVTKNETIDFIFQHEPECNAIIKNDKYTIWGYYFPMDNSSLTQSEKIIRCMNLVFPGNAQFLMRDFVVFPYDPAVFEIYQINPVGEEADLSYVEYFFILLENGVIVYTGSAVNDMDVYFFMYDLAYNTIAPAGNPYIKE